MQKLVEFAKSGIPVIFDQQIPGDVPGLNNVSQRLYELLAQREIIKDISQVSVVHNIDSVLQTLAIPKVGFPMCGLEFIRKKMDGGKVFFITNLDDKFQDGSIELDELYQNITAYDPITGNFSLFH